MDENEFSLVHVAKYTCVIVIEPNASPMCIRTFLFDFVLGILGGRKLLTQLSYSSMNSPGQYEYILLFGERMVTLIDFHRLTKFPYIRQWP